MNNFLKLCINENIKTMKKKSTIVLIVLVLVSVFIAVGFTKIAQKMNAFVVDIDSQVVNEFAISQINEINANIENAKKRGDNQELAHLEAKLEMSKYAKENNIDIFFQTMQSWKNELVNEIIDEKSKLNLLNSMKDTVKNDEILKQQLKVDNLFNILKTNDFDGYINSNIAELKIKLDNSEISNEEYNESINIQNLTKKYEIGKNIIDDKYAWKSELITEISILQKNIRTGIDINSSKALTVDEIQKQKDALLIDMYRLENNLPIESSQGSDTNYRHFYISTAESLSMMLIGLLVIIMAGSAIATEMSSGTIKFLVMTPNKRWKILLAKIINIVVILLVLTIIVSLLSILVGNIFFSEYGTNPYLSVKNGEVQSLGYFGYELLRFLTFDIDLFMYLLLAILLSTITRNTSFAVGLSIASYIGSGLIMNVVNISIHSDWIKFIPFNNMNLTEKIFSGSTPYMLMQSSSDMLNNVPISFSLIVLAVCVVLMLVTMFDSFAKKDIL
ncbi:MAG: ABC transporter permease subunit [Clostridia bacterium]